MHFTRATRAGDEETAKERQRDSSLRCKEKRKEKSEAWRREKKKKKAGKGEREIERCFGRQRENFNYVKGRKMCNMSLSLGETKRGLATGLAESERRDERRGKRKKNFLSFFFQVSLCSRRGRTQ